MNTARDWYDTGIDPNFHVESVQWIEWIQIVG